MASMAEFIYRVCNRFVVPSTSDMGTHRNTPSGMLACVQGRDTNNWLQSQSLLLKPPRPKGECTDC